MEQQEVQQKEIVTGKTVLSINAPTPMWATWIFRIVFLLTTTATFIIASDPAIPDALKVRIGIYLKGLDFVIWGLGRFIGVEKPDIPPPSNPT